MVTGRAVGPAHGRWQRRNVCADTNQRTAQGWLTLTQVDALKVLASTVGATYTLMIEAEIFVVQFRHEDFPAIEVEPLIPRLNEEATDFYSGTIKLLTV